MTTDNEQSFDDIDDIMAESQRVPTCGFNYAYIRFLCQEVCHDYGPWWPLKIEAWWWMREYHNITKDSHEKGEAIESGEATPDELGLQTMSKDEFVEFMNKMREEHGEPS